MALGIRVTSDARKQIREANDWWVENRPAARDLVRTELERAFLLISSQPSLAPPALDPGLEQVRRLHLYRIGYSLYYRLATDGSVQVLGLWHTSRGSGAQV